MSLLVCVQLCFLFTVSCIASPLLSGDTPYFPPDDIRTVVEAEKYLLDGAELLHYKSPQMILYRKRGSPANAAADFLWLNQLQKPRIVTGTDRLAVHGKVGNRHLTFYEGIGVYPQITITKFELGTGKTIHSYTKAFWYFGEPKTINN